jgi:uncharacterized iron-regulated membrane protein
VGFIAMPAAPSSALRTEHDAPSSDVSLRVARRRSLLWRIHAWAALIASPFALIATLTGSLYVVTPQIEQALYGSLEHVSVAGERHSLDEMVAAAMAAVPAGSVVQSVQPGVAETDAVRVTVLATPVADHAGHESPAPHDHVVAANLSAPADNKVETTLYVNPYTAAVIGAVPEQQRFSNWAKKLHSTLLQGEGWRWMIELAASWLMVMLLTGIYLWWPGSAQAGVPTAGLRGRAAWKQWHGVIGVLLGVLTFVMLATGITWSKYAGSQVRYARDVAGQVPPRVPRDLVSLRAGDAAMLSWQSAWEAARSAAPQLSLQLSPPRDAQGTWRVSSADKRQPAKKFDLVLEAYTGQPLYYAGWDNQTAFSKATAIGIPFHRGELGVWNQVLLGLFAAGMLLSLISGWVMFFKRRRTGWLGMPVLMPGALHAVSAWMWLVAAGLLVLMPLLALSTLLVLMLEWYWWWTGSNAVLPNVLPTAT